MFEFCTKQEAEGTGKEEEETDAGAAQDSEVFIEKSLASSPEVPPLSYFPVHSILSDHQLLESLLKVEIKAITLSNHAPMLVVLSLKALPVRQIIWRLDKSLLHDHRVAKDLELGLDLFFLGSTQGLHERKINSREG